MTQREEKPEDKALEAYQLFVSALINAVDSLGSKTERMFLSFLALQMQDAHGLPRDVVQMENRLNEFIRVVEDYQKRGGDTAALKTALCIRAHIRAGEN